MQQLIIWQNGSMSIDSSLEVLRNALEDPQALAWLDLMIDTDSLQKYADLLKNNFKLTSLTFDTIQEETERAKLVEHRDYFYLVVHALNFDSETITASTPKLDIAFGRNFIVTIHRASLPWLNNLLTDTRNNTTDDTMLSHGMPRLLYSLLDALVDSYFPILDTIDDLVDDLEDAAVEKADNTVQARIFSAKRALAQMRRVISPQVEVSNALITRTRDFIPAEAQAYFSDVHDHLVRTFEVLDSYRDLLSGLLDVYLSTVSNNLNVIMKQLAIISTIFLPITFITGVFGQNFGHLPQVEHDSGLNFWLILALMAVITLTQIWYFRYRRWL